jgi:O-antigen biosynthesis protein
MASLVSDRGGAQGAAHAHAAAPNLLLAVRRIADLLASPQVAVVGPMHLDLGGQPAVVASDRIDEAVEEASRDGVVVLSERTPWTGLDAARTIVAVDPAPQGSALDALAEIEAGARAAGWHVAHAGLLHTAGAGELSVRRECPLVVACKPQDDELMRALATGPLGVALDPAVRSAPAAARGARVLIASYEVAGPTGNGGIGTAYHSLAHVLADAGHDVTLLFTGWVDPERAQDEAEWRRSFAASGIEFAFLGTPWDLPIRSPHHAVRRAYELHRWLAEAHAANPFDVVHIPECIGHGALALTAKSLGLAYADVEFVVGTHSSTRWVAECNREPIEQVDMLVTEHLERISVERADVVLSPTAYLVDYMRDRGWVLPERTFVQPLARPRSVRCAATERRTDPSPEHCRELVFFGRLETRKGLEAFCDAVDLLAAEPDCPFERVTFLGRPEQVMGESADAFVARRAASWDVAWEILPDLGHEQAIAYLRSHECVVAIPSLVDNSPNTVIEAVALGVPFVASRSGGTAELIAADDLAASTFDGWRASSALEPPTFTACETPFDARALATALREKASRPADPVAAAVDDAACDRTYDEWHRALAARRDAGLEPTARDRRSPTAAVCIAATKADDVRRVASLLRAGTCAPAQIVAVCTEAPGEAIPGVEVDVAAGRASGPARARLTATLDADVVIVLRGTEDPDPTLVERVCEAIGAGDADVLSLVCRDHVAERDAGLPAHQRRTEVPADLRAFVPVGGPAVAAVAYPALAVGPYAIRRSALTALGGWAGDTWGEACDRELLARAALADLRIDVLPDPLATTVRDDRWSAMRASYWGDGPIPAPEGEELARILRPFRDGLGERLGDLPALVVGALRSAGAAATQQVAHARERQEIVDVYEGRIGEFRELVELYEQRMEDQRVLIERYERERLNGPTLRGLLRGRLLRGRSGHVARRLRHAARGPLHAWPGRGVRFARWRLELLRRRQR